MTVPNDATKALAWLPGSVGAATRTGDPEVDSEALRSGKSWERLLESLRHGSEVMAANSDGDEELAAGYRHLLVLLALGIDEALRTSDPYDPFIKPGNVDSVLKWGMDCPDAAYLGAAVRGDAVYRLRGQRGSVRYLGLQVMGGIESTANVVVDDLEIGADGTFEVVLSNQKRPGNWMALS
ncbi:MAG TPA: hypothetical protein VEJ87_06770, partial [Acidimicrobiales bacterium]|nr:hypothetical protein [Acidimicrobiales bacterium]